MKSIKFSEKELDFIRQQYQVELDEAETYVENLKNILNKIGSTPKGIEIIEITEKKHRGRKPKGQIEPTVKVVRKRGPKPEIQKEETAITGVKKGGRPSIKKEDPIITKENKGRKPRSDKGKQRLKTVKPVKPDTQPKKTILPPTESQTDKIFASSKKKVKRRRNYKRYGVILTPMSKPIKLKEEDEKSSPAPEVPPF
jgi:hypothetical protein